MSEYFSHFPFIDHDLTQNGDTVKLTNILRRFKVRSSVQDRLDVYYEYDIQSGDRPDIIAEKYYGNSNYAWVVLHFNNIEDPIFDWPLFYQDFDNYIKGKYGDINTAKASIKEYRKILTKKQTKVDGTIIPERYVVVDEETYNNLPQENRKMINCWDCEIEQNEKKRKIKILDKKYLSKIVGEVEDIVRNGV